MFGHFVTRCIKNKCAYGGWQRDGTTMKSMNVMQSCKYGRIDVHQLKVIILQHESTFVDDNKV